MKSEAKKISIDQAYSSPSWWYDLRGFFILTFGYNDTLLRQVRFFARGIRDWHLEAAIGSGTLARMVFLWKKIFLDHKPVRGVGFDYAPRMLAGAQGKFNPDQFELDLADAGHLKYADEQFDSINMANAFHCLPEPTRVLREFHRVLKKGGLVSVNVLLNGDPEKFFGRVSARISRWGQSKGILHAPFSESELIDLVKLAGFEIIEKQRVGYSLYLRLTKDLEVGVG